MSVGRRSRGSRRHSCGARNFSRSDRRQKRPESWKNPAFIRDITKRQKYVEETEILSVNTRQVRKKEREKDLTGYKRGKQGQTRRRIRYGACRVNEDEIAKLNLKTMKSLDRLLVESIREGFKERHCPRWYFYST